MNHSLEHQVKCLRVSIGRENLTVCIIPLECTGPLNHIFLKIRNPHCLGVTERKVNSRLCDATLTNSPA